VSYRGKLMHRMALYFSKVEPGRCYVINVRHDDDCPRLCGGECICDAVVEEPVPVAGPKDPRA